MLDLRESGLPLGLCPASRRLESGTLQHLIRGLASTPIPTPKTPFALSRLKLRDRRYSLQTICSRLFSRYFLRFGKDFEAEPCLRRRVLLFGIRSSSFSGQPVSTAAVGRLRQTPWVRLARLWK